MFQAAKKSFNNCVVPAGANVAHTRSHTKTLKLLPVPLAGVLRPAVAMEHQPLARPAQVVSRNQSSQHQTGGHRFINCPAHDAPRIQVHHNRQIHPAFAGAAVGHIARPDLIRAHWVEILIQQIARYAVAVFALGGYFVSHALRHLQAHLIHKPANPVSANFKAFRAKCLRHFPAAQAGSARFEQFLDPAAKLQLLSANQLARALAPVIVSRLADLHNPTQSPDWVVARFDLDEFKLYFISFAKKADVDSSHQRNTLINHV